MREVFIMVHNLEKDVKRWLKRKVSITLAVVTVFAITGSIGYAEALKTDYEKKDFGPLATVGGPTRGNVKDAFNTTNKRVNENTEAILAEVAAREAGDEALQTNIDAEAAAREAGDNALEEALKAEALERKISDNDLNARILRNVDAIEKNGEAIKENEEKIVREAEIRHEVDKMLGERITAETQDRKSTRLNSSHANISYAVFCLKKKNT